MSSSSLAEERMASNDIFGRNRFLELTGAALFGFAAQVFLRPHALASHGPTPYPCVSYGKCHCCNGTTCCESRCGWPGGTHSHCGNEKQCWYTCVSGCSTGCLYKCCDWHCGSCQGGHCICSKGIGPC